MPLRQAVGTVGFRGPGLLLLLLGGEGTERKAVCAQDGSRVETTAPPQPRGHPETLISKHMCRTCPHPECVPTQSVSAPL